MRHRTSLSVMVAQGYRDYNKHRAALPNFQNRSSTPTKRVRPNPINPLNTFETPTKRPKHLYSLHPSAIDPYDSPVSLLLSPSQQRKCIGPTPQKDGQVLGLFDGICGSPASKRLSKRTTRENLTGNRQATPSETAILNATPAANGTQKRPVSNSKLEFRDVQLTPSVKPVFKDCTPGSRESRFNLMLNDTPTFLRRDSQHTFALKTHTTEKEDEALWSPAAVRRVSQPAGRSLSAIIKGLRTVEDTQLDEEIGLLREMEVGPPADYPKLPKPKLFLKDNERAHLPFHSDGELQGDADVEIPASGGKGGDVKPTTVWKRKGQKRTTRRIRMMPNTSRWRSDPRRKSEISQDKGYSKDATETQRGGAELEALGYGAYGAARVSNGRTTSHENDSVNKGPKDRLGHPQQWNQDKDVLLVKGKKRISATAHANFRALNIRNKHNRARQGRQRFGSRR